MPFTKCLINGALVTEEHFERVKRDALTTASETDITYLPNGGSVIQFHTVSKVCMYTYTIAVYTNDIEQHLDIDFEPVLHKEILISLDIVAPYREAHRPTWIERTSRRQ